MYEHAFYREVGIKCANRITKHEFRREGGKREQGKGRAGEEEGMKQVFHHSATAEWGKVPRYMKQEISNTIVQTLNGSCLAPCIRPDTKRFKTNTMIH